MGSSRGINLFWWSSVKFEGKNQENFGDILSKYLVEKISGKNVVWKNPMKKNWLPFRRSIYTATGSILKHVSKDCIVWGSGIISKSDEVAEAEFVAVRGPETYNHLKNLGYKVNKVFGDPAILLPGLYAAKKEKGSEIGIIPHYVDYKMVSEWYNNDPQIKVIDLLTDDIEGVIDQINSCNLIVSSSLHGIIVAHAYEIPAVWVQFSKKLTGDNIKFVDYFKSVKLKPYKPEFINECLKMSEIETLLANYPNLPEANQIAELSRGLMEICPFKKEP